MNYYELLSQQMVPIIVSCVVSTLIVMVVVAISSNYIHKERPVVGAQPDDVPLPPEDPISSVINNDKTKGE